MAVNLINGVGAWSPVCNLQQLRTVIGPYLPLEMLVPERLAGLANDLNRLADHITDRISKDFIFAKPVAQPRDIIFAKLSEQVGRLVVLALTHPIAKINKEMIKLSLAKSLACRQIFPEMDDQENRAKTLNDRYFSHGKKKISKIDTLLKDLVSLTTLLQSYSLDRTKSYLRETFGVRGVDWIAGAENFIKSRTNFHLMLDLVIEPEELLQAAIKLVTGSLDRAYEESLGEKKT